MITLREYQRIQLDYRLTHREENVCIQSPTGTGKGLILSEELRYNLATDQKTLVLVPKQELTYNIARYVPNDSTVAYSGYKPQLEKPILVCTYQSALKYVKDFKPDRVISDECHGLNKGGLWARAVKLANVPHTGYTATPNRLDGQGLYHWFSKLSTSNQISWFIENGYLAPFELYFSSAPFFAESTDALDVQSLLFIPKIKDTVKMWLDTANGKKTIAFTTSNLHSFLLKQEFLNNGIIAEIVDHKTPTALRHQHVTNYRNGLITVLINVDLFTEGVNMPDVDCVLLARFTYSTARYLQMIGRGLRFLIGKILIILDIANNCFYHGSPSTAFHWSLEGEEIAVKTNQQRLHILCTNCQNDLVHRKNVIVSTAVSCLNCGQLNNIYPIGAKEKSVKRDSKFLHKLVSVEELHLMTDDTITALSKIVLNKKMKHDEKINSLVSMDIDIKLKIKMLTFIGLPIHDIHDILGIE